MAKKKLTPQHKLYNIHCVYTFSCAKCNYRFEELTYSEGDLDEGCELECPRCHTEGEASFEDYLDI